ncbi:NAD(P)H-hydrate dehydratase [Fulvivirga lutea]|uniref:Bifunctional NAD(P)H-hydrate repair enzyme n=1 Tax=Fulvivirga lutea TaxID=2810512 RepID=A0A975A2U7_9BACT|nr:NAD(P)H-hydrate dehydratase [Fulvivirga lutea]QSE98922.1 NAD(P)H-hydrate dehydratase [Fulvivirga lutea]
MKILSVENIRDLDAYTIEHEPISSFDLMERASKAFVQWFVSKVTSDKSILVVAGTGNNGGDGLAVARMLHDKKYQVKVVIIGNKDSGSDDFKTNLKRLSTQVFEFDSEAKLPKADIIIDAIFGSGLSRPAEGKYAILIEQINESGAEVASIDMPSGLFADRTTEGKSIVRANATVSFQLPKLAFMLPETYEYVGNWHTVDIGLSQKFISEQETSNYYITASFVKSLIKQTGKFDHKGMNGNALIVGGSLGKIGAAVLAAKAALRSGVGLLTVQVPRVGNSILQVAAPEAMTILDDQENLISSITSDGYNAIAIGPGLGTDSTTVKALGNFLTDYQKPLVLDADALNILSDNRVLMELIPENSILTPHPKEFKRLLGESWQNDFERLDKQKELSKKLKSIIILKGAHSSISLPNGEVYFNSTGNEGMAKGGSGDVLTGMLVSILGQGYSSRDAAILGVFLHGSAGDFAKNQLGSIAMKSGDLINFIPEAYAHIC